MTAARMYRCRTSALAILVLAAISASVFADDAAVPPANLISRKNWGAKPPVGAYRTHAIDSIVIHHQGVFAAAGQDARKRLNTMQSFHQSKQRGFVDIAYHYIIDRDGNLYEGRPLDASGETKTDYDPTGRLLICLLGDFNRQEPTAAQIETLKALLKWAFNTYHLSPDAVLGHRDLAHTDCPGRNLNRLLKDGTLFLLSGVETAHEPSASSTPESAGLSH